MDLKKISSFSANLFLPRRKVVSGFGLGILGSLVTIFILYNASFSNVPLLVTPMFQGLNSTWPFSFSSCSTSFLSRNHSDEENASLVAKDRNFLGSRREGKILEKTRVGDLRKEVKIGNFTLEEGRKGEILDKGLFGNGSNIGQKANVTFEEGRNLDKGLFGNEPNVAKNANFNFEEGSNLDKDLVGNEPNVDKDANFTFEVRNLDMGLSGNGSNVGKNSNFTFEEGRNLDKGLFGNRSNVGKKANFDSEEGRNFDKDSFGNGSNGDKNANFTLEKGWILPHEIDVDKNATFADELKEGNLVNAANIGKVVNFTKPQREVKNGTKDDVARIKVFENANVTTSLGSGESVGLLRSRKRVASHGECDIFHGRWIRDQKKPYYPAGSCPYIDRDFDCYVNGRPDDGFLKWRWQPFSCEIPSLNATDFLERLRGKKLVFVGDSLNRNMWESLVCILRHSIPNKKRVYEISGRQDFKKKGFYAFRFEDYNCSVDFVSSPFLVRETSFKGRKGSFETLHLDLMEQTTKMYIDGDIIVFNTGHWWTHEKTSRGENYYQEGSHVYPSLNVLEAYTKALTTWARWVDKHIDCKKAQVIFRGYSVTHFWGGQWNSGGQCHKESEPIFNETYLSNYPTKMKALEHVIREMKTPVIYLNISQLTDYRKDGHPSIYRKKYISVLEKIDAEQPQDCSHWCLPGVPDTWNELLYASLLQSGKGSWKI